MYVVFVGYLVFLFLFPNSWSFSPVLIDGTVTFPPQILSPTKVLIARPSNCLKAPEWLRRATVSAQPTLVVYCSQETTGSTEASIEGDWL